MGDEASIRKIYCVQLAVPDLDEGIGFYARLGLDVSGVARRKRDSGCPRRIPSSSFRPLALGSRR